MQDGPTSTQIQAHEETRFLRPGQWDEAHTQLSRCDNGQWCVSYLDNVVLWDRRFEEYDTAKEFFDAL